MIRAIDFAILFFASSGAFASNTVQCTEMTMAPGEHAVYRKLPEFQNNEKECYAGSSCRYGARIYTSTKYPKITVQTEANTDGAIDILITDHGALNPAKGKKAYTSTVAHGKGEVLGDYNVTVGDEYPLAGTQFSVACEIK